MQGVACCPHPNRLTLQRRGDCSVRFVNPEPVLACQLQALTPEQRVHHSLLTERLRSEALQLEELPDGYAFRFSPESQLALELIEFATLERQCCPFLRLEVIFEANDGELLLRLLGAAGVKPFLVRELELEPLLADPIY
jgi:hypothetical protein